MDEDSSDSIVNLISGIESDTAEKLIKTYRRLIKEKRNVEKYNEELQSQVKLLSAKLNLHQQFSKSLKIEASNQTELSCFNDEDDTCQFCGQKNNSWSKESRETNLSIGELVTKAATEIVQKNDYVYDEKSRTYYSKSSGWYFYPDRDLFFDPMSKNYYKYDKLKNTYEYYSSLHEVSKNKVDCKRRNTDIDKQEKKVKNQLIEDCDQISEDENLEEGEINSSGNDEDENEDEEEDDYRLNGTNINESFEDDEDEFLPPCIRLIVEKSSTLDEGSLLLVTCNGATIGCAESNELCIPDECVSRQHAQIHYNQDDRQYLILDKSSTNGTYINSKKVEQEVNVQISHGDIIRFGDTQLLAHIHKGDVTCIYCEPGCVQANLKNQNQISSCLVIQSASDKEKQRKSELKKLRHKYGINPYVIKDTAGTSDQYRNRSEERRKVKGSDCPYEKTEVPTLEMPLKPDNKGFRLLEKMGWSKDKKLDKSNEPVNIIGKEGRRGLGFDT